MDLINQTNRLIKVRIKELEKKDKKQKESLLCSQAMMNVSYFNY